MSSKGQGNQEKKKKKNIGQRVCSRLSNFLCIGSKSRPGDERAECQPYESSSNTPQRVNPDNHKASANFPRRSSHEANQRFPCHHYPASARPFETGQNYHAVTPPVDCSSTWSEPQKPQTNIHSGYPKSPQRQNVQKVKPELHSSPEKTSRAGLYDVQSTPSEEWHQPHIAAVRGQQPQSDEKNFSEVRGGAKSGEPRKPEPVVRQRVRGRYEGSSTERKTAQTLGPSHDKRPMSYHPKSKSLKTYPEGETSPTERKTAQSLGPSPDKRPMSYHPESKSLGPFLERKQEFYQMPAYLPKKCESMTLNSRVRFVGKEGCYAAGTVAWTGCPSNNYSVQCALVYLDQPSPDANNGILGNQQLAEKLEDNRYMLFNVVDLSPIRTKEGDFCFVIYGPKNSTKRKGFLRNQMGIKYELHPVDTLYTETTPKKFERFPDYLLQKIPPPVSDDVSDMIRPITSINFPTLLGRNKGIQGKHNSCYLDTLLFSIFAFSSYLDQLLFENINRCQDTSNLCYSIIFPLRACHFVADTRVRDLLGILSKVTKNPSFENESHDIPECVDALFVDILKIPAPLHVGSSNLFNPTFLVETLRPDKFLVPNFQDMLYFSAVDMDFCFQEA